MIIIIDAYNFLHANFLYAKKLTDRQRQDFIENCGIYGKRKGHKMIVVFDGGPYDWANKEKIGPVLVVHSGVHQTADDYIKEYLEKNRSKDLLLVSSDLELNRCADRLSLLSIDSVGFYILFKDALQKNSSGNLTQENITKISSITDEDIDSLMKEAAKTVPIKADDFVLCNKKGHNAKAKQSPKNDRALLKKLHKL
jgi:hypothetical protein